MDEHMCMHELVCACVNLCEHELQVYVQGQNLSLLHLFLTCFDKVMFGTLSVNIFRNPLRQVISHDQLPFQAEVISAAVMSEKVFPFLEEKISYVRKCGFFLKSRAYIKCLYELSFVCFVMGTYSNTLDTSDSILHWYMHIPIQLYPGLTETNFDDLIVLSVYAYMWRVQDKHMMCTGV